MKQKSNELSTNKQSRIYKANGGCNEDCLNCSYPDCYKPINEMDCKSPLSRINKKYNSNNTIYSSMFTLELGSMGRNTPNISKKFWL